MTKPTVSKSGAIKFRKDDLPDHHAKAAHMAKLAKGMDKKELEQRGNDPLSPKKPVKAA